MERPTQPRPRSRATSWFGRIATLSFLFFLVKGLVWLGIAGAVALGITR